MAVDQIAQALLQDLDVERSPDAITAHMRDAGSVLRTPQMVPNVLLQKGHRHGRCARNANDCGYAYRLQAPSVIDECGQR